MYIHIMKKIIYVLVGKIIKMSHYFYAEIQTNEC